MVPRKSGRQQGPGDVEEQPEGYAIRKTSTAGLIVMYIEGGFSDERGRRACGDWKRRGRRNEEGIGLDMWALESSGAGTDGGGVLPVPAGRSGRYPIGWARVEGRASWQPAWRAVQEVMVPVLLQEVNGQTGRVDGRGAE